MTNNQSPYIDKSGASFETVDLEKLKAILLKSLPFVVLIVALGLGLAAIVIRYTKPLYQSSSILQIDIKSEAKVLGFKSFDEDINNLAREIEIIKSKLFLNKVAEALDFKISYYKYGDILFEERFNSSPFAIYYQSIHPSLMNRPVDLEILDKNQYSLRYQIGDDQYVNTYNFEDTISTDHLQMVAILKSGFVPGSSERYFFTINDRASIVSYIHNNLVVEPLDFKAKTISISFKDYNRHKAREIVHAIDTLYVHYTQLELNKANNQKITFLNDQLAQTEQKLSELETYFETFTIDNKTTNLDANLARTIKIMEDLDSQRFILQRQLQIFNSINDQILSEDEFDLNPADIAYFSPEMKQELERLNKLFQDKQVLLNSYNENTLAFRKKTQEITYLKDRLLKYIESTRENLYQSLDALSKKRKKLENEFIELPSKRTEYTKTQRYYGLYEEFYLTLMKNKAEFELAQAGTVTDYRILSSATTPTDPISPNKFIYYGIGLMAGLFISFLFVGMRYLLHNKITNLQELEHTSNAFVLGNVPYLNYDKNNSSRLVVNKNLKSAISEAFRTIRTNLEFLNGHHDKIIIAITSTISGEGKTFVATNLGGIISLLKSKVILIDLDMRRPRFHEVFQHADESKGLSTILIGKHKIDECIHKTDLDNLDFIPAGPIPPNPSELILGGAFSELMEALKKTYDVIIIDTPPVGLVTDGIHALKIANIPIYVFRADFSKKSFLRNVTRVSRVNKLKNLSLILNSTRSRNSDRYGYNKGYYEGTLPPKRRRLKEIFHFFG